MVRLGSRDDLYAAVDRTISQLRSVSDQASPELNKSLRVPDVDRGSTSDWLPTSGWMPTVVDDFWSNFAHIRDGVLVPVVGPDLTVVDVGDAEQTFNALIGQRLADRYHLTMPPGLTTMVKRWRRFCESAVAITSSGCIASSTTSSWNSIPAPGDALRNLAAIEDLRLFVNTTPDRLLAKAVNEVRFQGGPKTRELTFSPTKCTGEQSRNAQAA